MSLRRFPLGLVVLALLGLLLAPQARPALFALTGEETLPAQLRGLGHLALDVLRPRLDLQPEVPIAHTGVNPYGINTFLQQEVEPAKRARQVQLIAEAGFHWLRQEFPWYDLEIAGKGNFEDCRFPPCHPAWDKYDQIIDLAEQAGLEILVRLSSPPAWSRADGEARGGFAPPDDFADFADYAAAVAGRYRGRLRYYQVWNEPNIYPEWGNQAVDPEAYTRLLCQAYARLKQVDPQIVVVSGVLAPTTELGGFNDLGGNNLNDFLYLQRMYAAGARDCFDVLSVQGYGLWSGPTDRRLRPIVVNYGRNQFIRDLMVANGDAHKAIWIAEMNWNAVPAGSGIPPDFGQVTELQQARYAPLAYARAQAEWPWVGASFFWFFKRADESEKSQAWYYFRMADPDFSLRPVYYYLSAYLHRPPRVQVGWFQEDHWAVIWEGWEQVTGAEYTLGAARRAARPGATARFTFEGTDLILEAAGRLQVRVDQAAPRVVDLGVASARRLVAGGLPAGPHTVEIVSPEAGGMLDGFIVRRAPDPTGRLLAVLGIGLLVWWLVSCRTTESLNR